jgi:hypothetical protein
MAYSRVGGGDEHGNLWKNDEHLGSSDILKWAVDEWSCLWMQVQK